MSKLFYRVGTENSQGLWYNNEGVFTGLIHKEFQWCKASQLLMPFETELVGYISVADSLEHLYQWFSKEELIKLQSLGFYILEYSATDFKFYELYKHNVISKKTSIVNNKLIIK
jgi:hypothetical protein